MGSKSGIADWVIAHLPAGEVLYDLFAGGCAITHAALLSPKWKKVVCNDITDAPKLFVDAAEGKYKDCDRWVSREEFRMFKDSDPFVRILWSFGNKQENYLYSVELEPYKKALHQLCFAKTPNDRRLAYKEVLRQFVEMGGINDERGHSETTMCGLENLSRLQSLENLSRLQSLENLSRLQGSYKDVEIPDNAIVYCDPPYKGTAAYTVDFDHEEFYDWVRRQTVPVYISEYWMPDDFELIDEVEKQVNLAGVKSGQKAMERLYGWNIKPYAKQTALFDPSPMTP